MDRKVNPSVAETVASDSLMGSGLASRAAEISRATSTAAEDEGRFVPGTLLGGRYRIIGLLGRGGMGEVYRATDLTLGQSVALKFLPEEASRNQRLLERFHGEVRVARLVSHPNVCRVYDIGEIEGMPFISMEYVDGEDLASLLLRIGRLPGDKAVETARKLCAGLTAAHDRGVIHRDLKPQNIMINKRGEVVIMDFGLAAISDQLSGAEVRNGTPAYMAPEQLKGSGVTVKSDIYALGLVLYELFTGKRPYDARNVQQLIDLQDSVNLASMTSVAPDIDPGVEKVIRRCLDPDPAKRPAGALAVAAALPGGDPLAAALAAGETPSPEMVAAAGAIQGMPRVWAMFCLLLTVACLLAQIPIRQRRTAFFHGALDAPPDVLAHQSRTTAESFGYTRKPADTDIWLVHRSELVNYLSSLPQPRHWDEWYAAEAPIVAFYRESPQPLDARPFGLVTSLNPPPFTAGMATVVLDGNGRLVDFSAVPYDAGSATVPPETVFRAAGLDMAAFSETAPENLPTHPFDQRHAWKGPHPKIPQTELLVEIASWKGQITRATVSIRRPKTGNAEAAGDLNRVQTIAIWTLTCVGGFFVLLLARRNWKLRRTDMQGAWRVAVARFILAGIAWAGMVHPVIGVAFFEHVGGERGRLADGCGGAVPGVPGTGAGGPRALAALDRYLESRAGGALAGPASGFGRSPRSGRRHGNVYVFQIDLCVDAACAAGEFRCEPAIRHGSPPVDRRERAQSGGRPAVRAADFSDDFRIAPHAAQRHAGRAGSGCAVHPDAGRRFLLRGAAHHDGALHRGLRRAGLRSAAQRPGGDHRYAVFCRQRECRDSGDELEQLVRARGTGQPAAAGRDRRICVPAIARRAGSVGRRRTGITLRLPPG